MRGKAYLVKAALGPRWADLLPCPVNTCITHCVWERIFG